MNERNTIDTFLAGRNPGYGTISGWVDTVVFFHGWGHRIEAPDVKQEALTALVVNLKAGKYKGGGLKGYTQTICKNHCLMALRKSYKSNTTDIDAVEVVDQSNNPEEELESEERRLEFSRIFDSLTALCRKMLVLRYLKNRSFRDIGKHLGLAEGTARVRVFRCLEHARSLSQDAADL